MPLPKTIPFGTKPVTPVPAPTNTQQPKTIPFGSTPPSFPTGESPASHQSLLSKVGSAIGGYAKNVGSDIYNSTKNIVSNTEQLGNTPQANPFDSANNDITTPQGRSNILTGTKAIVHMLVQNTGEGVNAVFAPITELLKPAINAEANAVANDQSGEFQQFANGKVGDAIAKIQQNIEAWSQIHPNQSKDLNAGLNTVMALVGEKPANTIADAAPEAIKSGASEVANIVDPGIRKVGEIATQAGNKLGDIADKNATNEQFNVLKPKLTPTEIAARKISNPETFTGENITSPTPSETKMLDATKGIVDSSKTPTENISSLKTNIGTEANKLRQGLRESDTAAQADRAKTEAFLKNASPTEKANFYKSIGGKENVNASGVLKSKNSLFLKELPAELDKVDIPDPVKNEPVMAKNVASLKNAAVQLYRNASNRGGEGLLDLRQNMDNYIKNNYGANFFDKGKNFDPFHTYVYNLRDHLTDIAASRLPEGKLPDGTTFQESLQKQTSMYRAIDNLANKPQLNPTILEKVSNVLKSHPLAQVAGTVGGIEALSHPQAAIASLIAYGVYKGAKGIITSDTFLRGMSDFLKSAGDTLNPSDKSAIQSVIEAVGKKHN